jgi:cardiolipin synthase
MSALREYLAQFDWTLRSWDLALLITYALAILTVPSVLLKRRGHPHAAVSWLLALFALPFVGVVLWWAMGRTHLRRKRKKRRKAAQKMNVRLARLREERPRISPADWNLAPFSRVPADDLDWVFPPTAGNRVELLVDAGEFFPSLEEAVRQARHHIHLMFYIWNGDATGARLRDLLCEKARQGVEVRVLCDALGSPAMRKHIMNPLRECGGHVATSLPIAFFARQQYANFRNHRKLVVVDAKTAIVGGFNIGDEYLGAWHDTAIRIEGPAVDQLQEVFVDDWFFALGEDVTKPRYFGHWQEALAGADKKPTAACAVVASGPHTTSNSIHDAVFIAITRANKRVWITTPYFIPDASILTALRTAVYRGVDVRVLAPEQTDARLVRLASRSYYPQLLESGVKIYEYKPAILHSKTILFDDELSAVGSANMDIRSFKLNFELNCFVNDGELARRLAGLFEKNLRDSRQIKLADLENRSLPAKLIESAAHLFSPLL